MKRCTKCGQEKPIEEFYNNGNRKQSVCKDCYKEKIRNTYSEKVEKINTYKENIGCQKCGEKRVHLLDFHHNDRTQKDFTISDKSRMCFENLMKEIQKCSILCSNCHRDFHYLESKIDITIEEYLHNDVEG